MGTNSAKLLSHLLPVLTLMHQKNINISYIGSLGNELCLLQQHLDGSKVHMQEHTLTAIFLLLEGMPHSAGILVVSAAYFGCLLLTELCRSATHCHIHRL